MAKGEKTFSTSGRDVKKGGFKLVPPGEYELKLDTAKAEVRKKNEPGSFPRVAVSFTAVGTAEDGGKDARVFHDFYVRTEPNAKGTVLVDMSHQLTAFCRALGQAAKGLPLIDINGESCVDPRALLKWLKNRDGEVVKGKVKVEKRQDGEQQNRIDYFIEAEGAEEDEEADEDEEDEADEDLESDEEDDDEDDLDAAAKKKASKKKARR